MAVRFKLSNFQPNDGRIAYADLVCPHAAGVGDLAWIHFSVRALAQATACAAARDPFVIYQSLPAVGVLRQITHLVLPVADIALNRAPNNLFPHQIPVFVLAAMHFAQLGARPHANGTHRVVGQAPVPPTRINEVLWDQNGQPAPLNWFVMAGQPFARVGGNSVCTEWLWRVLSNGQYGLTANAHDVLFAASQRGLNH